MEVVVAVADVVVVVMVGGAVVLADVFAGSPALATHEHSLAILKVMIGFHHSPACSSPPRICWGVSTAVNKNYACHFPAMSFRLSRDFSPSLCVHIRISRSAGGGSISAKLGIHPFAHRSEFGARRARARCSPVATRSLIAADAGHTHAR